MCGIAGVFCLDGQPVLPELTAKMRSVMAHRGPDDEGEYLEGPVALVSRRLSIIDLSPAGHQPMCNENGTLWACFNGEIYNYLELVPTLEARGHRFRSRTDTEVILHAYEESGPECIHLLNGMFAFAIWDRKAQQLFIARDRMGVKPLYYTLHQNRLIFGSEIKAILQDESVPRVPDPTAIHEYLQYGYNLDARTFFSGIKKLMPGHWLLARQEGIAVRRYWEIPPVAQEDGARPEHEYIRECRELLEDAVRIRLRSDVPVGFHLSGGLDSSSVLALARGAMSQTPLTFSGAFTEDPRYDERPYIRTMVAALGTDHHEVIPQYGDFPGELASIIWFMDEPAVGPGVFPQLAVSRLCKQHVKVVLGGQGGDELFGGYQKYTIGYLRDYTHQLLHGRHALDPAELGRMAVNLAGKLQYLGVGNSMTKVLRRRRRGKVSWFTPEALAQVAPPADQPRLDATGDHLHQEMLWDMRYYLPGLLQVEDRVSMAVSIEARTPFLDYRVVEFAARLPPMLRLKNLITKYVVRQAVRDLVPARIVNRRDKRGFPTPIDIWFRQDLKDWVYEMLIGSPRLRQRGLFDPGIVARLYDEHQRGQDNSLALWSLLCVEVWFRTFNDRPVPATFMPHVESVSA